MTEAEAYTRCPSYQENSIKKIKVLTKWVGKEQLSNILQATSIASANLMQPFEVVRFEVPFSIPDLRKKNLKTEIS